MSATFEPPMQYLRDCSDSSLRHYEVVKLEHVANLRRELRVLWDEMLEESSLALMARWMIEHRSYLRSRVQTVEPALAVLGEPPWLTTPPIDTDHLQGETAPALANIPAAAAARGPVLVDPAQRPSPATGRDFPSAALDRTPDSSAIPRTMPARKKSRGDARHDREGSSPARSTAPWRPVAR